jgi:glycerol-3-phosphate acyltransferase
MAKWNRIFSTMISLLLHGGRRTPLSSFCPSDPVQRDGCPPPTEDDQQTTLLVDVDTALLRSGDDTFPYFMLVALEAGGFLRGLLLLLLYPLLFVLPATTTRAVMAFVAFCGLRATRFRAGRAVLPKWFMDDVAAEAFEAVSSSSRRVVCVSRGMPRVMVDGFLREYLGADAVVGREMKTLWGFYTGLFMEDEEELVLTTDDDGAAAAAVVGFSGSSEFLKHPLARSCKVLPHVLGLVLNSLRAGL